MPLSDPGQIHHAVTEHVGTERTVVVTGTLERRLLLIENSPGEPWTAADLSGRTHASRTWPAWVRGNLVITEPNDWLSPVEVTDQARHRLLRPRLLLTSLYHPEHFPLPRFPLAISDLARAARLSLLGQVELMDMQLGATLPDILARVASGEVDILGISATFGQHDLMTRLLDEVTVADQPPLLVAGGSLTVRNERVLLDRYPNLIIGRGAGEPTIADVLAHWHGDLGREQIRGAAFRGSARGEGTLTIGRARRTATVANRSQTDIWPELDLLDATFAHNGVAQLELSRGCTSTCSFCPRGHKGQWAGADPDGTGWMLAALREVFDRHPRISRTLYVVDEEFIGRGADAVPRALATADQLAAAGFTWETSCRIDQVVHPGQDHDWHLDRAQMWRDLVQRGLRRCLFGVESGVTTILQRFHKETTGEQNALAIRTLTALGVPPRFTYLTFDHLMTVEELRQTYEFQGRTDLLLAPRPKLSVAEIVDGVRDAQWVAAHTTGRPFYTAISYPLVGMECLIGAAYTRRVEAAGLAGQPDLSMGRVQARYADWRIGVLADWAQRWIDRNFPLDYTLKSLEKILTGPAYHRVRDLRQVFKSTAYHLLGDLLAVLAETDPDTSDRLRLQQRCAAVVEDLIRQLHAALDPIMTTTVLDLPPEHRDLLQREYDRWSATHTWQLINAADPCGT
ncbi:MULTISPECIES: radical SAM protein [unclassified Crossiella]|uniref:B12-binding domain-containing radical SAM protein n=1 Tax=unclassified Crossiella TaxID=2620835 RepID=UPI001FFF0B0B|nr:MULTISPECIES: radical SAM protein [unclassified Crossiella]MCK2245264.1 radical SAM protein [Crossiella sp. S99.2]MCK2258917.1 radical SAM protein [Crossiella sp. S99.1]